MDARETVKSIFEESLRFKNRFFSDDVNVSAIAGAASALVECYRRGGKVIVFGNGGSAADSQHLAAELVVRFEKERKSFPCVALTTDTSVLTAASNDYGFNRSFSRQVEALAGPSDLVIAISTSGNSENVLEAVRVARAKKVPVIALTGRDGGKLVDESDISVVVKGENTARIQEVHVTVLHIICKLVEDAF
ncbi:MAG: phosphoheptose isomerase [Candidatus Makaraimicrobium thalassicum]|nr:MAG: phosphoheptose isomerase [Candidatus Omnitrophota bacterium]